MGHGLEIHSGKAASAAVPLLLSMLLRLSLRILQPQTPGPTPETRDRAPWPQNPAKPHHAGKPLPPEAPTPKAKAARRKDPAEPRHAGQGPRADHPKGLRLPSHPPRDLTRQAPQPAAPTSDNPRGGTPG